MIVSGACEYVAGRVFRYEASWERSGDRIRWKAFVFANDWVLIGSPGGTLDVLEGTNTSVQVLSLVERSLDDFLSGVPGSDWLRSLGGGVRVPLLPPRLQAGRAPSLVGRRRAV